MHDFQNLCHNRKYTWARLFLDCVYKANQTSLQPISKQFKKFLFVYGSKAASIPVQILSVLKRFYINGHF